MRLRDALDLCTHLHADDWIAMPSGARGRPATNMLAGLFDPGMTDPRPRPLVGHTIAVYEPDARLSIVWPVPEDDQEYEDPSVREYVPEWAERDSQTWKHARAGWAVILLNGAPIWQEPVCCIDWGSGIGGYVAYFRERFGKDDQSGTPTLEGWETTTWSIGLARLLNVFSNAGSEFARFEPTSRVVPEPSRLHPVDEQRHRFGY
jgi:hypothetical protein